MFFIAFQSMIVHLYCLGKGEMPHVELSHVDGGILEPCLGETFDETASQIISFGEQYPANVCKKELHITNTMYVDLIFS